MTTTNRIELAAKTAHEVNRAYCQGLGDNSQMPWDEAPDGQRESVILRVRLIADDPDCPAIASHGPVKDVEKKEHPCFVSHSSLPERYRAKEVLFDVAVRGILAKTREKNYV